MLRRNAFLLFVGLLLIIPIVNCGHSSKPVISGTLPNGTAGTPYSGTLTVTGGVAPFTWSITGLPATLTFASSGTTVTISGTPLAAGTISGTATVTDSKGHSSAAFPFSFTIAAAPTPVISGTLPNGNVDVPYSGTLTVTGGVPPFTWNITGLPATLTFAFSGNTVTISGTPLVAATISGTATVTDATQTSSAAFPFTFTIGPVPALTITPASLPQLTVGTATNQVLTVNPATIGPYTWKITAGPTLPPGLSFTGGTSTEPTVIMTTTTNTVTITGTPLTAGNFPVQITVTDSATPPNTTFVNYPIVVVNSNANACPAGSNNAGLAAGTTYAFLLRGFDGAPAQIVIAGSFTVDGKGGITAGDMDSNGFTNGPQEAGTSLDTANSTYSFGLSGPTDTRGCLSLVFNTGAAAKPAINGKVQGNTARRFGSTSRRAIRPDAPLPPPPIPSRIVFQFALGGQTAGIFTTGNIIEFDNVDGSGTSASGVMHVQDTTAFNVTSLAANFAFGLSGWDFNPSRAALAGSFTNAGGTLGPIFADFNDAGTLSGEITGGSGVINTVSTSTGRATASFTVPGVLSAVDAVVYVLNANDFYVLLDDAVSANVPLLSGRALATSATFAAGALNGSFLFASEGFDATNFANDVTIGTAQFSSTGNTATASFTQSDAGTVTTPTFTGTYAVDATNPSSGRVSFTVASGTDTTPPVVYLTNGGDGIEQIQGFSVGTDANVGSGILVNQSATAPDFTSVSGTYAFGSWEDVDGQNGSFSGLAIFTAPSTYSAVEDETFVALPPATVLSFGTAVNGTFTLVPTGTGTITVGANTSVFVTNGVQIFSIAPGTNSSPDAFLATYTNVVAP
jgi:large repetitive protein